MTRRRQLLVTILGVCAIAVACVPTTPTPPKPPVAIITATPPTGAAPLAVTFSSTDSRSQNTDGAISGQSWTFGDNSTASGSTATHTYTEAGTYLARLTVTDTSGTTASATITVNVSAATNPLTVTDPANASSSNNPSPTLSGVASDGAGDAATVTLVIAQGPSTVQTLSAPRTATAWTARVSAPLPDGTYTATASQVLASTVTVTSPPVTFTVDTSAPTGLTISSPADTATVGTATPTISGAAGIAPGDSGAVTVAIAEGGTPAQTVTGTRTGATWSAPVTTPLANGTYTATVTQTDGSGNSATSPPVTFTVDSTGPVVTIAAPVDGGSINSATPTISGTAGTGPGDSDTVTVVISHDGAASQTLSAARNGTPGWSVPSTTPLADGTYTATATQTSTGGTVGTSSTVTFTVDTVAPTGVTITDPADGSVLNHGSTTVSGTAGSAAGDGATVTVAITQGPVVVDTLTPTVSAGAWSVPTSGPLADGTYTVLATQSDAAGNSTAADPHTFTVDSTGPAVAITSPGDGSSTRNASPLITGTAGDGPGDSTSINVVVLNGTTVIQSVSALRTGTDWITALTAPLADGTYTVTATQGDSAGNSTSRSVTFVVDRTPPDSVAVTSPVDGAGISSATPPITGTAGGAAGDSDTVTVVISQGGTPVQTLTAKPTATFTWTVTPTPLADGTYTVDATQTDAAGNSTTSDSRTFTVDTTPPSNVTVISPVDSSFTNNSSPTFSGTAGNADGDADGVTVVISRGGAVVQTLSARRNGTTAWSVPPTTPLDDGTYTVTATQIDEVGNVTSSPPTTFTVATVAPGIHITSPADNSSTNQTTPTYVGTAGDNLGDSASIDIVVTRGGVVVDTLTATRAGATWSVPATHTLDDGTYTVTATQTDGASNVGSSTISFTVDTKAPTGVAITSPTDNTSTDQSKPVFTGTAGHAADDSTSVAVTIAQDGITVQTSIAVRSNSTWTAAATTALADGTYTVTATQTDAAGNSTTSDPRSFTVDTSPPTAVTVISPVDTSFSNNSSPTFGGTAGTADGDSATVSVVVSRNNDTVQSLTTTRTDEAWSVAVSEPLADGTYTVTATQTDKAGNSTTSPANTFTVDTEAPTHVAITNPTDHASLATGTPSFAGTSDFGVSNATITISQSGSTVQVLHSFSGLGSWSTSPATPLADGTYTVSVTVTDAAGNMTTTPTITFRVDTSAPSGVTVVSPVTGSSINDSAPAVSGTAGKDAGDSTSVSVTIRQQATVVRSLTATNDLGVWSVPAGGALADGTYTVTATQTDKAGNSTTSPANTFTIDTRPPTDLTLTSPATLSSSAESSPTFAGTAGTAAGDSDAITVTINQGALIIQNLTATRAGSDWSIAASSPLPDGSYTVSATQSDSVGNSSTTEMVTFTVDATAPQSSAAIVPGAAFSSSGTTYSAPVAESAWTGAFTGTASDTGDGASGVQHVAISIQQVSTGRYWSGSAFTNADETFERASGTTTWTYAFPADAFPAGGQYAVRTQATDRDGNIQTAGSATAFDVDFDPSATVFVSPLGNDANSGLTPSSAKATINGAIAVATGPTPLIAVATGTYTDAVTDPSAIALTIRGGYSPTTWLRAGPEAGPTTVTGSGTGVLITSEAGANLQQLIVNSGSPTLPGADAYGVRADSAGPLDISRSTITAANGATGADGSPGGNGGGSFGVFSLGTIVTIDANSTVTTGDGGGGGTATVGPGGSGGSSIALLSKGGHGIAFAGSPSTQLTVGDPGFGGAGSPVGADGTAARTQSLA